MNVPAKLGIYGLGLAVAFAGALGAGALVGPVLPASEAAQAPGSAEEGGGRAEGAESAEGVGGALPGLKVSDRGYTLEPVEAPDGAEGQGVLSFRVTGPGGEPVTGFQEAHEKRMHLIVVGRDMAGYRHLHPEMGEDGLWATETAFGDPGPYRMFADFLPEGEDDGLVLGADIAVTGDYAPATLPAEEPVARVDGYEVRLDGGLDGGGVRFTVSRDGEEVDDLDPYLGAYGHLVALRAGDLAYLHVHPHGTPGGGATPPGPEVAFEAEAPSDGTYRLFFDFKHEGRVRTAEFTVHSGGAPGVGADGENGADADDGHGEPGEGGDSHGGDGH